MATIIAERSEFQDLIETVRTIARRADDIMDKIDTVIDTSGPLVSSTLRNVEKFSQALGNNADGVDKLMASVAQAASNIAPLAQRLDGLGQQVSTLVASVDARKITSAIDNVEKFTGALGGSSGDVTKAMGEVASITQKLNKAADQVEGVLKAAQDFLGAAAGGDGEGALAEIKNAARSIRTLADNLDGRTAQITAGINRFTGRGCAISRRWRPMGGAPCPTSTGPCAISRKTRNSSFSVESRRSPNIAAGVDAAEMGWHGASGIAKPTGHGAGRLRRADGGLLGRQRADDL